MPNPPRLRFPVARMNTLLIAAIQCGAVAAGYALGRYTVESIGYSLYHWEYMALAALVLLIVGSCSRTEPRDDQPRRPTATTFALVYCFGVLALELFGIAVEKVTSQPEVFTATAFLLPLVAVVGPLVRARAWCSVAGVSMFIVAYVGIMTANVHFAYCWSGFALNSGVY